MYSEQRLTSSTQLTQKLFTGLSFKSKDHSEQFAMKRSGPIKYLFRVHMISHSHTCPANSTQLRDVLAIRCFDVLPLAPSPISSLLSVKVKRGQADGGHCCYWAM